MSDRKIPSHISKNIKWMRIYIQDQIIATWTLKMHIKNILFLRLRGSKCPKKHIWLQT